MIGTLLPCVARRINTLSLSCITFTNYSGTQALNVSVLPSLDFISAPVAAPSSVRADVQPERLRRVRLARDHFPRLIIDDLFEHGLAVTGAGGAVVVGVRGRRLTHPRVKRDGLLPARIEEIRVDEIGAGRVFGR